MPEDLQYNSDAEQPVLPKWDPRLLCIVVAAFLTGHILVPVAGALLLDEDDPEQLIFSVGGTVLSLLMVLSVVRRISGSWQNTGNMLSLHALPWRDILTALPKAAGIILGGCVITVLWSWGAGLCGITFATPPTVDIMSNGSFAQAAGLAFSALAASPILEEIFFRKAIYEGITFAVGGRVAMVVTALFFAAMHLSWQQLPGLMFFSMMWQWSYLRSKSLWSSILLHFFNNLFAVGLLGIGRCCGWDM